MQVDQGKLAVVPIQNQFVAGAKGPLGLRLFLDFGALPAGDTSYQLDLQNVQALNQFDLCQTLYIDNADGGAAVVVTIGAPGVPIFRVTARAGSQGYYNVICPNPILMQFSSAGGAPCTIHLINVAIPGATWSAI